MIGAPIEEPHCWLRWYDFPGPVSFVWLAQSCPCYAVFGAVEHVPGPERWCGCPRARLDIFDDLFDAVASVFEFFVERFVVMVMILQALEQVSGKVGSVACRITVSDNLHQFVYEHALVILRMHAQGLRVQPS